MYMQNSDFFCKNAVVLLSDAMSMDFFLTLSKIVHSKKQQHCYMTVSKVQNCLQQLIQKHACKKYLSGK